MKVAQETSSGISIFKQLLFVLSSFQLQLITGNGDHPNEIAVHSLFRISPTGEDCACEMNL
jgi:hypothetical protein